MVEKSEYGDGLRPEITEKQRLDRCATRN